MIYVSYTCFDKKTMINNHISSKTHKMAQTHRKRYKRPRVKRPLSSNSLNALTTNEVMTYEANNIYDMLICMNRNCLLTSMLPVYHYDSMLLDLYENIAKWSKSTE